VLDSDKPCWIPKEGVLDTNQTAKRVVLDFDKPYSIQKSTADGRDKKKVTEYNQNNLVAGKGFRKSGGIWMV